MQKLSILLTLTLLGFLYLDISQAGLRPANRPASVSSIASISNLCHHNFLATITLQIFSCVSFLFQLFGGFISFVVRDGTEGPTPCVSSRAEIMGGEGEEKQERVNFTSYGL